MDFDKEADEAIRLANSGKLRHNSNFHEQRKQVRISKKEPKKNHIKWLLGILLFGVLAGAISYNAYINAKLELYKECGINIKQDYPNGQKGVLPADEIEFESSEVWDKARDNLFGNSR